MEVSFLIKRSGRMGTWEPLSPWCKIAIYLLVTATGLTYRRRYNNRIGNISKTPGSVLQNNVPI
jgi:hypothetical protein